MRLLRLAIATSLAGIAVAAVVAWLGDAWQRWSYREPEGMRLAKPCISDRVCDHVVDEARVFAIGEIGRVNQFLASVHAESDVDIRAVFRRGADAQADALSGVAAMEALRVGSLTREQRGLLLQFDMDHRRLSVVVGYGLEGYFPDVFVAYLVDQHSRLFFDSQQHALALQMLVRLLHQRIREATLGGEFDPRFLSAVRAHHLSSGAGADRGTASGAEVTRAASAEAADLYRAAATPRQTFARYLRMLAEPEWLAESDLFTAASRAYLRRLPLSLAYRHYILMLEHGKAFEVVERGDHALLYFTGTPFASPHFLVREDGLWRLDIGAELNSTTQRVGGAYTWSFKTLEEPAIARFGDLVIEVDGHLRVRGGDNQPLPVRRKDRR